MRACARASLVALPGMGGEAPPVLLPTLPTVMPMSPPLQMDTMTEGSFVRNRAVGFCF